MNRLLTDAEIKQVMRLAYQQAQLYDDNGTPIPERAVADAQDTKTLKAVGEWLNRRGTHHPDIANGMGMEVFISDNEVDELLQGKLP